MISFKKSFVGAGTTHDVIKMINKRKELENEENFEDRNNHLVNQTPNRYSAIVLTANKRHSSLSPNVDIGFWRHPNSAFTSKSRKRKTYYDHRKDELNDTDNYLINPKHKYSALDRRSVTIDTNSNYCELGNPRMYKSKPRLQVWIYNYLLWLN